MCPTDSAYPTHASSRPRGTLQASAQLLCCAIQTTALLLHRGDDCLGAAIDVSAFKLERKGDPLMSCCPCLQVRQWRPGLLGWSLHGCRQAASWRAPNRSGRASQIASEKPSSAPVRGSRCVLLSHDQPNSSCTEHKACHCTPASVLSWPCCCTQQAHYAQLGLSVSLSSARSWKLPCSLTPADP